MFPIVFDGVGCPRVPNDVGIAGAAVVLLEGLPWAYHTVSTVYGTPSRSNVNVACSRLTRGDAIRCCFANAKGGASSDASS